MSTKRLSGDEGVVFSFDFTVEPALKVKLGEPFVVETTDPDLPERLRTALGHWPPELNPVSGPIYVEGVARGDVLVVSVESITVADHGWSGWGEHAGGILGPATLWPDLDKPYSQVIKHVPGPSGTSKDGKAILNESKGGFRRVEWDLAPFIGTLATAPDREIESSLVGQGPFGGNMDCRDIKMGTRVYLPAFHDGGLLFCGDIHATQGDTEFFGSADESQGEMTFVCDVIKSKAINNPRLEKADSIVAVCSYRPLEEAVRKATFDLMDWMITDHGMDPKEAYLHASVNPDFRINVYQMVPWGRLAYTAGAEIPKKYL